MLRYLVDPIFQVINTAGKPATGGYIEVYLHGTRDKYYCSSDFNGTLHPFKIPLDSLGANIVLADDSNAYDVYVYNRYGTLLMSRYNVYPVGGNADGVKPSDLKPLTLKRGEHTIGSYSPLQQKTIDIGDSVLFVPDDTEDLHAKITQMLSNGTTPVLTKAVTVGGVESVYRYYPTARTGASSDYSFIGYNGGLIEFAKVKDDDNVSYETYDGGEGRIVYIGYEDADIYTKVSDAFAAGLVPVVKDAINADTTVWKNYYWPLNLSAYEAPAPGEEDGRNGYYFVGKAEIRDSEGNPLTAIEMIQVKPDGSVSTSYIPERQTPQEKYSDFYGIGLKTNSFGQVTEVTYGTQQSFLVSTGIGQSSHVLTSEEIAQGYYDIHIGLPSLRVRGKSITPDSLYITDCEILACICMASHDENREYSVSKLEVLLDSINPDNPYFLDYICRVDDFTKDEFGRLIPNEFTEQNRNDYRYNFVRAPLIGYANQYIRGFIIRNYINFDYGGSGEPLPEPGVGWAGPRVDITVSVKCISMENAIANLPIVSNPNTLRFRFTDPSYSPVVAGVGTSGTWTKREEFTTNVWDWTNNNSSWIRAFKNAWTSEDLDVEFVELVAAGDTSAVTDVLEMFMGCSALRSAIAFDTSNVTSFVNMFKQCTDLEDVPYFKTDSATHVTSMFDGCTGVKSGALALYTRMSGQATPPNHINAFKDCGKDTTTGLAELQQIPASWGGLAP